MFKPDNIPQLSPYLTVVDSIKSMQFYKNAFGFIVEDNVQDDNGISTHVSMRKQDVYIMFSPEGAFNSTKQAPINLGINIPINLYVYCEDVDTLYKQAIAHGANSILEPQDSFWGDRFCTMLDIDGYEWSFATTLSTYN